MKFNLKNETNHLVDEIDYETYDIDEYMLMEGTTWMKTYSMNENKKFDSMDDVDKNYEYSWI
jgi:hypothetical protein